LPLEGNTIWTIKPPSVNKEGGFFVGIRIKKAALEIFKCSFKFNVFPQTS
jgi:hypothetical protein